MKITRPSPAMVVAGLALFVSLGGTSIAAVNYAARAGSVDGRSAVSSSATLSHAAGKLVATSSSGDDAGRLPGKFVSDVAKTQTFSKVYEVADNAPGAPQLVQTIKGLGNLTTTCNDQAAGPGVEDPVSVITYNNTSGGPENVARRVGNGDGQILLTPNQTASPVTIPGSNTFFFHVDQAGHDAIVMGGVRQEGRGTPAATCALYGVVMQAMP
jgi:hypothetical protein